jgi:hypothetical protein
MQKEKDRSIMREEIEKRIKSDSWDAQVSGRVLRARKRSRGYKAFGGGISAAAAVVLILFFAARPGDRAAVAESGLHSFISTQVESTYGQVFTAHAADSSVSGSNGYGSYEAVDYVIADSLSER